ncbi:unnamed protein product [Rhodiola kirilowii]
MVCLCSYSSIIVALDVAVAVAAQLEQKSLEKIK